MKPPIRPFRQDPSATASFAALRPASLKSSATNVGCGLKAVVIGGGTGAPVSIRTLLSLGVETSAVVAMADDGGSTGILREEADVTPPGDVRKCIAAFARNPSDPLTQAFKCRLAVARDHTLGNLMLSALEDACGSFPEAIRICERLVEAQGHVYPSTLDRVTLMARTREGELLQGQANACRSKAPLERAWLEAAGSAEVRAYAPALAAIREADLIVLGPGSLFTSIIACVLVPGIVEAVRASRGRVLFVCSLADVQGETRGLSAADYVKALNDHGMRGLIDYVLVNGEASTRSGGAGEDGAAGSKRGRGAKRSFGAGGASGVGEGLAGVVGTPSSESVRPVFATYRDVQAIQQAGSVVIARNLADPRHPTWHEPRALCDAFSGVLRLCRSRQR